VVRRDPPLEKVLGEVDPQDCETREDIAMGLCYALQEPIRLPPPRGSSGMKWRSWGWTKARGLI